MQDVEDEVRLQSPLLQDQNIAWEGPPGIPGKWEGKCVISAKYILIYKVRLTFSYVEVAWWEVCAPECKGELLLLSP